MKTMKKVLSVILTIAMVIGVCLPLTLTATAWEGRTNEADVRIGFLNDTHIAKSGSGEEKSILALETFKTLGMDKMAFVGDNVYYPSASDDPLTNRDGYQKLHNAIQNTGWTWDDVLVYAMGNHEFPQSNNDTQVHADSIEVWKEETGFDIEQHTTYEGFHFIAVAPESGANSYTKRESYMKQEIEAALAADSTNDVDGVFPEGVIPNSTKPVFLFTHQPMSNTVTNGSTGAVSDAFLAYLATRPQVISIVGHKHRLAQHPENIGQDAGFTTFLSPMTAGGYQSWWDCEEEYNITDSVCSQGSFMEIKDNVVSFYRLDFVNGTYIGEPYVVDIPAIVADRTNEDSTDDYNHMPFRTEVRNQVTSEAAFPADAEVTVEVIKTNVNITFPNTATMLSYDEVQQDNFVRAYKVEIEDANGNVVSSKQYQADFYVAPEKRVESYTKSVGGLKIGAEYTVNVYPMAPLGTYGDPISATFETEEVQKDKDAIRVEFENFSDYEAQKKTSEYASGNGILLSAQGGWVSGYKVIERTEDGSSLKFTAKVNAPIAGKYDVQYAVGYRSSTNVSTVRLSVGEQVIGDNASTSNVLGDLSIDGTYPWKHIALRLYEGNAVTLAEGENDITVEITAPTKTTQPFLFCMDYIDFIPQTAMIDLSATDRIEFETYKDNVASITDSAGASYLPKVSEGKGASGGKYLNFDSEPVDDGVTAEVPIPVYVSQSGMYNFRYVAINRNNVNVYVDSKDNGNIHNNVTATQLETAKVMFDDGTERYETFSTKWFPAYEYSFNAELTEGKHTLIFEIGKGSNSDIVQYMDYLEITPATKTLSQTQNAYFEFEDYQSQFAPAKPSVNEHAKASGGKLVRTGGGSNGKNDSVTLAFYVEEAGTYDVEYHAATGSHLSTVNLNIGDKTIYTASTNGVDISENKTYYSGSYPMRKHTFTVDLEEGYTKLVFDIAYRPNYNNTTAYAMDFIDIRPQLNGTVSQNDVMRMEFESLVGTLPEIPERDGTPFIPSAGNSAGCSGGKYLYIDSGASDETYYEIVTRFKVEDAGKYDVKYVTAHNVSVMDVFLGDSASGILVNADYTLEDINVGKNGTGEEPTRENWYRYFSSTWAKPRTYTTSVNLTEGYQVVTFRVKTRGGSNADFAQYLDYFQIAPTESFAIENGTANVKAVYDTAVSGKAILALYNGKELVSANTVDVNNAKIVEASAPAGTTVTSAKLFVWQDMTAYVPVTKAKEFTVK